MGVRGGVSWYSQSSPPPTPQRPPNPVRCVPDASDCPFLFLSHGHGHVYVTAYMAKPNKLINYLIKGFGAEGTVPGTVGLVLSLINLLEYSIVYILSRLICRTASNAIP